MICIFFSDLDSVCFSFPDYVLIRTWMQIRWRQRGMHFSHFARISLFTVFVHTPNRTFLVRFGGISGEFGRAMVRILVRRSRAKIPMARPNVPKFSPKFSVIVRYVV